MSVYEHTFVDIYNKETFLSRGEFKWLATYSSIDYSPTKDIPVCINK